MDKFLPPQATSPLSMWLNYLENLHSKAIDLGLARIRQVAQQLDVLKPAPVIFTVAGTNGKGTTCRMLETLLIAADYRVGVYSSPHLIRYTERVRIQGSELPEAAYPAVFAAIEAARGETSLTYFEFGTLAALMLFKHANVDVVILEVGLGGRLDATNIVDPDVAVITSIALDHEDWLGSDRESIGREKAGIFRSGKPAIVGEPDIPASVIDVARQKGALLHCRGVEWTLQSDRHFWNFGDRNGSLCDLALPQIPLSNAATALAALRASQLSVDESVLRKSLPLVQLPGRFETVSMRPRVILDVAHNPHAAAWLASQLNQLHDKGRVLAVVGMLHDKDIAGTLACLIPQVDAWYCAGLEGPRGASAEELMAYLPAARSFKCVTDAWCAALTAARAEDTVLVCGSFLTVAAVMMQRERENHSGK
ncbi:bifunctional tetrahydrofolate synthase/dihydrofolate synthase [Enterobacteriaceae bacterium LUAb1]